MRSFLALIVAPALALACQSMLYALVTPSCSVQTRVLLHLVAAAFLALTVGLALLARSEWKLRRRVAVGEDERRQGPAETRRLLAAAGTAVASLSGLVILTMWIAAWLLSPCFS